MRITDAFHRLVCILQGLVRRDQSESRGTTPSVARAIPALALGVILTSMAACSGVTHEAATPAPAESAISQAPAIGVQRDADVPDLPFPDNPDPNACGIPTRFGGGAAWVNGAYQGQLIEPTVLLYDSHERQHVTGAVSSGTEVQVQLYQSNPVLDFYYVQADTPAGPQKGWVPAPFLQFTPPSS